MTHKMKVAKIIVTGPFNCGKTTFLNQASEIGHVHTERKLLNQPQNPKVGLTTVVIGFGRITVDETLVLYMFEPPGARRYDLMWEITRENVVGFLTMFDSSNSSTFLESVRIYETFCHHLPYNVPHIFVANKQDKDDIWSPEDIHTIMRLPVNAQIVPCVATEKESVKSVLLALCHAIQDDIESSD